MLRYIFPLFTAGALALSGCASGAGPTPKAVISAGEQTLDIANRAGHAYVILPLCTGANGPVCSNAATAADTKAKSATAYRALVAAQAAVDADPGVSKSQTAAALTDAQAALAAFSAVTSGLPR